MFHSTATKCLKIVNSISRLKLNVGGLEKVGIGFQSQYSHLRPSIWDRAFAQARNFERLEIIQRRNLC